MENGRQSGVCQLTLVVQQTMFWKKNEIAARFALYVSLDVRYGFVA